MFRAPENDIEYPVLETAGETSAARRAARASPHPLARNAPRASRRGRHVRIARSLRIFVSALAALMFFSVSAVLGLFVWLTMRLRPRGAERGAHFELRKLNRGFGTFAAFLRDTKLIRYPLISMPDAYRGRAVLVVANHPTLADIILLLACMPELTTVVKAEWYRSFLLGPMLRGTDYIPGPGYEGDDEAAELTPVVARIEEMLRKGVPVVVFPEGTRSGPAGSADFGLRRFRRGAVEAAVRAGVPVLPIFITVDPPLMSKGMTIWDMPDDTARFGFEWLAPVETEGREAREITRELHRTYVERLGAIVGEEQP